MTMPGTVSRALPAAGRGAVRHPVTRLLPAPPASPVFGGPPGRRLALRGQTHEVEPVAVVVPLVSPSLPPLPMIAAAALATGAARARPSPGRTGRQRGSPPPASRVRHQPPTRGTGPRRWRGWHGETTVGGAGGTGTAAAQTAVLASARKPKHSDYLGRLRDRRG